MKKMNAKTLFFIVLILLGIISCQKKNPLKEKIVGVWIGVEQPQLDTAFFYENNTARIKGRADIKNNYTINEQYIVFSSEKDTSRHEYSFSENDTKIYIRSLLIAGWMMEDGIVFKKLK